jgi:hypothetical protein
MSTMSENAPGLTPGLHEPELQGVVKHLEYLTSRLRFTSLMIVSFTGLSFLSVFMFRIFEAVGIRVTPLWANLSILLFPIYSLWMLIRFDSLKRKGDVVFKELSDELQWYVRYEKDKRGMSEPSARSRPELSTRIVLREYAASTTLPLVPSDFGPTIYALTNISVAMADLFLRAMRGF